jgi:hypothetical protein
VLKEETLCSCVQTSQKRLDLVQSKARATAKAMVRSATARALRDELNSIATKPDGESEEEAVRTSSSLLVVE